MGSRVRRSPLGQPRRVGRLRVAGSLVRSALRSGDRRRLLTVVLLLVAMAVVVKVTSVAVGSLLYSGL